MPLETVDADEVQEMDATVVNVLSKPMYDKIHIEGSKSVPLDELKEGAWEELDEPVIVYCANTECEASDKAGAFLVSKGVEVYDYEGGMQDWAEHGLPTDGSMTRDEFLDEGF